MDADAMWREWRNLLSGESPDPLEVARLAAVFERYFDAVKTEAVRVARARGHSWEVVAGAIGTTRQSAWERYRKAERIRGGEWIGLARGDLLGSARIVAPEA